MVVDNQALLGIATDWWDALMAWRDYKMFGLPYPGGYMQQPAIWVAVMRIIEAESNIWQEDNRGDIGAAKNRSQGRSR